MDMIQADGWNGRLSVSNTREIECTHARPTDRCNVVGLDWRIGIRWLVDVPIVAERPWLRCAVHVVVHQVRKDIGLDTEVVGAMPDESNVESAIMGSFIM